MNDERMKILLVEDSSTDAQLLRESLQDYPQQQFEIAHVERLDEAIRLLTDESFDVILLDLNLPDSQGILTCDRMSQAAEQTPIIILTGADDEAIASEAMHLGAQDYLVKGYTPGHMIGRTVRYTVERRRSQRALRESEVRYRTLFTNMNEGFALGEAVFHEDGTPCDFHFLEINDAFERESGLTREILGKPMTEVLPNLEQSWIDTYCHVALTGESVRFVNYNKDTDRHYDVFCYSPSRNRFAILFRDVTEQVRSEQALQEMNERLQQQTEELQSQAEELQSQTEELRVTNEALEQREREYRTLAENTPEMIARFDRRLRHTYINEYGARVYGVSRREVTGKTNAELGMPAGTVAFWRQHFEQVVATGRQQTVGFEFDSPTFGHQYFSSILVPEPDIRGQVVSVLAITRDVTAIKQTEQVLREEKRLSESMVESLPGIFYLFDSNGKWLKWNRNLEQVSGYSAAEIAQMHPLDFFTSEDKELIARRIEEVFTKGETSVEAEFVSKDGRRIPHFFTGLKTTIRGADCLIGMGVDISERRQAEEALRSVALFPEQNPWPVLRVARNGALLYANSASACLLELWNCRAGQTVPQEIHERVERALDTDQETEMEIACGAIVYSLSIAPIASEDYVNLYGRDITAPKQAEEALRESEGRHRRLIENLKGSHFVYVHDTDGVFQYLSESITDVLGYLPEEFMAHYSTYMTDHPANQDVHRHTDLSIQGIRQPPYEINIRHKDGSTRWLEVQEVPVFDDQGRVIAVEGVAQDITDRKHTEEALRESEQWFRTLTNTMPQLVWTAGPDGRVDYYNERSREYAGIEARADGSFEWIPMLHADDVAATVAAWERAVRTGETYQIEHRIRLADGRYRWHLSRGMPIRDDESRIVKWFGTATDIDDLKHAEEALRASETRLRTVLATLPVGVLILDETNNIVDTNGYFERLYAGSGTLPVSLQDYRRDHAWWAASGEPVLDSDWPSAQALRRGVVVPGQEIEIEQADGGRAVILDAGAPLRDDQGNVTGAVVVVQDITERKQAEEALRESEERFRTLADNMSQFAWMADENGGTFWFNKRWYEYTGTTLEEMQGWGWQKVHDPNHVQRVVEKFRRHLENGLAWEDTFPLRGRDGRYRWFLSRAIPIRDEQGRIIRWFGTNTDVTEQRQAQEALRELTRTLEARVARRTQELEHRARQLQKMTLELSQAEDRERRRLADVLHDDLQQQLAAVKFHLGRMGSRARDDAALRQMVTQLDTMLGTAIETSRSLSHELSPAMLYHSDLGETLEWLASQIRAKHGLAVRVHADGRVHSESDALKAFLYRAAQEMLFNVVKHARVGQARVRVRRMGRCICLIVSDSGRGFNPQDLKAAAGFGLFSIRERVQLLGGRMKIKSAPGQGSTFFIAVPDGPMQGNAEQAENRRWQAAEESPTSGLPPSTLDSPLRVLVADDHEIVRQGLAALLREQQDIEFIGEAANGREAVDLASRLKPDVVIMDVAMPLMNGDEATRQTKMHLPGTRVIALSMYAEDSMVEKMRRAGADCYILKTAPAEELLAAVRGRKACA